MRKLLVGEKRALGLAVLMVFVTSALNLSAPVVMAQAIDGPLAAGDFKGILSYGGVLFALYLAALFTQYRQTLWMGSVGVRILYLLRSQVFNKLQQLPLEFFARRKAGDLISRINNDTDKVHVFFSQSLMQFVGGFVVMAGSVFFLLGLNWRLGLMALVPALIMLAITSIVNKAIKELNAKSLNRMGELSADVSESLSNFHVMVAFDRQDYFCSHFNEVNKENYRWALRAGWSNGALAPVYAFCAQAGQLIVLLYGVSLVVQGRLTIGFLISYFVYLNRFYDPMRQLAALWANFQGANAAYDRISEILAEPCRLALLPETQVEPGASRLEFRGLSFGYSEDKTVLNEVSFRLEEGKRYAFVGPTGGGKSTTASLMARLYDPLAGTVLLDGKDLRSYSGEERGQKIGFILQEPFLFGGTVGDNLSSLEGLEAIFSQGLDTPVESLSLGQRQVVAFLRAVLRAPQLLILDEATANIDTVTEALLGKLLDRLPATTTLVIIAHRLNTIENADQIFFVNSGSVQLAGSMQQAVALLRKETRVS